VKKGGEKSSSNRQNSLAATWVILSKNKQKIKGDSHAK
jgi:hypothetical protein